MEYGTMLDRIKKMIDEDPDNINILEEVIDVNLQLKYFKVSVKVKKDLNVDEVLANMDLLFLETTPKKDKKRLLTQLASVNKVEAYRAIEQYSKKPDSSLKGWSVLALQESRMLIHALLLDKTPVFISTGLGGKDKKLRYFAVFSSADLTTPFSELQQSIIKGEIGFLAEKAQAEIEKLVFYPEFCSLTILIPLQQSVKDLFGKVVVNCNEFGNFVHNSFMVTNVKCLSEAEIRQSIAEARDRNKDSSSVES
jgi:hypothetical protein